MTPADPDHRPSTPPTDADQTRTFAFDPSSTVTHLGPPITGPVATWPAGLTRYKPLHLLGNGGMGEVYLAHDTQLDRQVAIKFARRANADTASRILAEARAAARLHHPGICPVFDADVCDGMPYLTMAFVQGPNLAAELKRLGPCPPAYAAKLIRSVAQAMQYAHDSGVIHRDLKPANILLTADHDPVVTDFGLAVRLDREGLADGVISGTPYYMAPEQAAGDAGKIGERTDVFALGVILFEMLTGRVPFDGTPREVLEQVKTKTLPPVRKVRKQVPQRLARIVAKATARRPADRYDDMTAFADDLGNYVADVKPPSRGKAGRIVRNAFLITGGVLLLWCLIPTCLGILLPAIQKVREARRGTAKGEPADALVAEGRELEAGGKVDAALAKYSEAIRLDPAHLPARERRAELELTLPQGGIAAEDFAVLRRADPSRADYHSGWGRAALRDEFESSMPLSGLSWEEIQKNVDKEFAARYAVVLDAAELAIRLDSKHARGYLLRAEVHIELKNYQQAEADATTAIKLEPANPVHWRTRGQARSLAGREAEALADTNHAAELEKRPPTPLSPPKK